MTTIEATITWRTEEQGCLENPFSGIQPSLVVGEELIMSRIERMDGKKEMERGKTYPVRVILPYGEKYQENIFVGMDVRLQVGSRVIADGVVTATQ